MCSEGAGDAGKDDSILHLKFNFFLTGQSRMHKILPLAST